MLKLQLLVIWGQQMTHWKSPWCWERLRAEGEEDVRGWDGWMASPMQWTWTWANSGRWWGTGRPGMVQSSGLQSQTHLGDWTTTTSCGVPYLITGEISPPQVAPHPGTSQHQARPQLTALCLRCNPQRCWSFWTRLLLLIFFFFL